jgi:hypothetical protein
VTSVELFGERAHVRIDGDGPNADVRLRDVLRSVDIEVDSIRRVAPSLEDVFIARLGEARS